jgi:hypothetical protein
LRRVEELRNRLAHGRDLVAGSTWPEVIETATTEKDLTDRLEDPDPMDGLGFGQEAGGKPLRS